MTPKKGWVTIGIRLLSLYSVWVGLISLPSQVASLFSVSEPNPMVTAALLRTLVFTVTTLLAGAFLWFFSFPLSNVVCKGCEEPNTDDVQISFSQMQAMCISLLGLFILSNAIPTLVNTIVTYLVPSTNPRYVYSLEAGGKHGAQIPIADYVPVLLNVGLGLWFLLGSRAIAGFLASVWERRKSGLG